VGGEKMELLEDPAVRRLLSRRYGLVLDCTKSGSIEMIREQMPAGIDFLWPSSQLALEMVSRRSAALPLKSELILFSPIVLYAWEPAARVLESAGLSAEKNGIYLVTDFPGLIRSALDGKT
jgi:hypothetical protein